MTRIMLCISAMVVLVACNRMAGNHATTLEGEWRSESISHASPFFKDSADETGTISLIFEAPSQFSWKESDGPSLTGRYRIVGKTLTFSPKGEEAIPFYFQREQGRLTLKSPDGFIFVFQQSDGGK